jgi:hypothetical protein
LEHGCCAGRMRVTCAFSKPAEQKRSHWTVPVSALLSPPMRAPKRPNRAHRRRGPRVRILLAPAASLQTFGPSRWGAGKSVRTGTLRWCKPDSPTFWSRVIRRRGHPPPRSRSTSGRSSMRLCDLQWVNQLMRPATAGIRYRAQVLGGGVCRPTGQPLVLSDAHRRD